MGTVFVQEVPERAVQEAVSQRDARAGRQAAEYGPHRQPDILPPRLAGLDIGVHATVLAAFVQKVPEREQRRGLARLARRAQNEVAPVPDAAENAFEIDALERRNAVVVRGNDRPGRVEEALGHPGTALPPGAPPDAPRRAKRGGPSGFAPPDRPRAGRPSA